VRSHLDRHHLLIADQAGDVIGVLAYRTDWFQCTFVTLVSVREDHRKRGIARALYRAMVDRRDHIDNLPRLSRAALLQRATLAGRGRARGSPAP